MINTFQSYSSARDNWTPYPTVHYCSYHLGANIGARHLNDYADIVLGIRLVRRAGQHQWRVTVQLSSLPLPGSVGQVQVSPC